jgi:hypothetical protein
MSCRIAGSKFLTFTQPVTQLGRVVSDSGFLVIIFGLGWVDSGFFLIRVKILACARPVAWSSWVRFFSGGLGRVYQVERTMIRSTRHPPCPEGPNTA